MRPRLSYVVLQAVAAGSGGAVGLDGAACGIVLGAVDAGGVAHFGDAACGVVLVAHRAIRAGEAADLPALGVADGAHLPFCGR